VIHVASWHQIANKTELSRALGVVATRIPHDQVRIALVADGAEWICETEMRAAAPDHVIHSFRQMEMFHGTAAYQSRR
jgi:hypothetical protein